MSQSLAVGVDAGGTSIVAALSRDGAYARSFSGPPAQPTLRGVEATAAGIADAVRELCGEARPQRLFVAAAGAGRPAIALALRAALRASLGGAERLVVEDDTRVALRAALPEGPGIVVIAGTGSAGYAENGDRSVRVGGAGYLLGDEGSGFAIGLAAARLLARAYDGRAPHDETTAHVARALDAPDRDALLGAIYAGPPDVARIAALAPFVLASASNGNRSATKIVQEAATALAELARSAAKACELADRSPDVVFAGGLLRENSLLSFLLETRITNEIAGASVIRLRDEPARAALRLAEALA